MIKIMVFAAAVFAATQSYAQSSLGIQSARIELGGAQDEAQDFQAEAGIGVDVAITSYHGLQGNLQFSDTANGMIGQLGAHLYMTPNSGRKYGVFATLSDVDDRSMTWGTLGVEGMMALGLDTVIEGRTGLGVADEAGLDFIFAGVSIAHKVTSTLEVESFLDIAEFDEPALQAISYEVGIAAHYSPEDVPWGLYASLTHSDLTGRDGTSGDTRLGVGFTIEFGASRGTDPTTRQFRSSDPVEPLIRRGLW
ncbi:MAG: hypothetical protein ACR2O1_04260 [Boseongicola sp.]